MILKVKDVLVEINAPGVKNIRETKGFKKIIAHLEKTNTEYEIISE